MTLRPGGRRTVTSRPAAVTFKDAGCAPEGSVTRTSTLPPVTSAGSVERAVSESPASRPSWVATPMVTTVPRSANTASVVFMGAF